MKKSLATLPILLLLTACHPGRFSTTPIEFFEDSEHVEVSVQVDFPDSGSRHLKDSIRTFINETMGGTYKGDLSEGQDMVAHYGKAYADELKQLQSDFEDSMPLYTKGIAIFNEYEQDKFVSYVVYTDEFTGGAHGFHTQSGVTFRASDGRRMGFNLLQHTDDEAFQALLADGLQDYFGLEPLDEWLWEFDQLPLPQAVPYLTATGVAFVYQSYEIAPYSSGTPYFIIPYEKMRPYLSDEALALITPDE